MPSPEFLLHINELDSQLGGDKYRLPSRDLIRQYLSTRGQFMVLGHSNTTKLTSWLQGMPVASCDGSRVEYGPFYPHSLVLQRAMVIATHTSESITEENCCSPLIPEIAQEIERYASQKVMSAADAYSRWLQRRLASLEVKVSARAVCQWKPRLMLMDGGLLLFDTLPGFAELVNNCAEFNTMLVGVIEEIATAELGTHLAANGHKIYDRELLYGLLEPGEIYLLAVDKPIKKNYRTAFTRFSSRPAATACDFLPGTSEEDIISCLELLQATTGVTGRGVPFLLDQVDRKVRIGRQEGQVLLKMGLSAATYERFFTSQRQYRNI